MDWSYFDKFDGICDKYLPVSGEGDTIATQIVTAVCKLVYKWYNDGDVFDNTHYLEGWANDLSSYANWLRRYAKAGYILDEIEDVINSTEYEQLLADLADTLLDEDYLDKRNHESKVGSIYDCEGPFRFVEDWGDEDDDDDWDDEEEDIETEEEEYDEEETEED